MPVLDDLMGSFPTDSGVGPGRSGRLASAGRAERRGVSGWLPICSNSVCASGWLRLWRARQAPIFEGGWSCGVECTRTLVRAAITREWKGHREPAAAHRHRVPLGLLLLSQGAINREQLRAALVRQKLEGGRLGERLQEQGVEERVITRGLGAQWGCPVLTLENHLPEKVSWLAPRLLVDGFGFLPLRTAGGTLLYLGFEDGIDRCVSFAIERMNGLRVESGVVDGRIFAVAHRRILAAAFPPARLVAAAGVDALAATFTRMLEEVKPSEARLVRVHDYFWLRMWKRRPGAEAARNVGVEDVLGSLGDAQA